VFTRSPDTAQPVRSIETLLQAEPGPSGKVLMLAAGIAMTLAMATLRLSVQANLAISLTPLLPIMVIAWYMGTRWGLGMTVFVVSSWLIADLLGTTPEVPHWVIYVNSTVRTCVLGLTALLVAALRSAYRKQQLLATSDALTGLGNRLRFIAVAEAERQRAGRFGHPITLAYLDLDDFKGVNDKFGHQVGDAVLRLVGTYLQGRLRRIDTVARLGGDEFVVLLPQTGGQAGLHVIAELQRGLSAALSEHGFEVGVSGGVATFLQAPRDVDEMLQAGDQLMYAAKREDKGGLRHIVVSGNPADMSRRRHDA
jgi:diguanylate cyclase (GGDEF)-like protein